MIYRSLLFAPGDSDHKIQKALATRTDALVLDLEDAVTPENREKARELVSQTISNSGNDHPLRLWVRVNPIKTADCLADLAAIVTPGLAGVMVPKPDSAEDIDIIGHYLNALEKKAGIPLGTVKILSVMTETAKAFLQAKSYTRPYRERLAGLLWGAEDLSTDLGASSNTDLEGSLSFTYRMARSFCLAAAAASECQPIDTVYTDFKNPDGLRDNCRAAKREGFLGKIAIHPNQVDIINESFTPSEEEMAEAQAIIEAFQSNPGAGTVGLNGKMLDRPHYVQAERVLNLAKIFKKT